MGKKRPDGMAIENVVEMLRYTKCPNVRQAQGSSDFARAPELGCTTPDIIAGPFYGLDHPMNFYIDVQSPESDYLDSKGQDPTETANPRMLYEEALVTGIFRFPDLDTKHISRFLLGQFRRKMRKYNKRNSALYGHIFYYDAAFGPPKDQIGAHDCLRLFSALASEAHGKVVGDKLLQAMDYGMIQGHEIYWPDQPFAFIGLMAFFGPDHVSLILLRNRFVHGSPALDGHPVIEWLRSPPPL